MLQVCRKTAEARIILEYNSQLTSSMIRRFLRSNRRDSFQPRFHTPASDGSAQSERRRPGKVVGASVFLEQFEAVRGGKARVERRDDLRNVGLVFQERHAQDVSPITPRNERRRGMSTSVVNLPAARRTARQSAGRRGRDHETSPLRYWKRASCLSLADNVRNRHFLGNELELEKSIGDALLLRDDGVVQALDPVGLTLERLD